MGAEGQGAGRRRMPRPITGLDHVLVGVRDLEGARAAYARLGFTLTPRGRHIGWGTANYCIMFADDYIELLGIVDPGQFTNNLDRFLAVREGLLGLALATDDAAAAAAAAALAERGVAVGAPEDLARDLELPEGTVRPRFRLVHPAPEATPGVSAFLCQHLTPELIRSPEWTVHANGARTIASVTAVVESPRALAPAYERLMGPGAVAAEGEEALSLALGAARLDFLTPAAARRRHPDAPAPSRLAPPYLLAMAVAVADPRETARFLAEAGLAFERRADGGLHVPPELAAGVWLQFVPAD